MSAVGRRVLILVENLSVPLDRRVWQESLTLRDAGYEVVVVCPQGIGREAAAFERIDGIRIHRFPLVAAEGGPLGYAREYFQALWRTARLVRRLARTESFDIVHACNPPDLLLLAALPLRRRGTRFVFDHHDLVPELYLSRFGGRRGLLYNIALGLERLTYRVAHVVLATNDSYRRVALTRGRKSADDVFVVRNGPDTAKFRPSAADPVLGDSRHLIAYVGMMGPQDGVDHALRALAALRRIRRDWHAVFVGSGDALPSMKRLAKSLGLADEIEFAGLVDQDEVVRILAGAQVCLSPEPSNPLNDVSTMIKVGEYMAMGKPVVCFDLAETRFTAGEAALYASPNDDEELARRIDELLTDPDLCARLGAVGRERAESVLAWERSKPQLLAAYERALAGGGRV